MTLDVSTRADGSLVIRASGDVGVESAVHLRQTLVHAVRRTRPLRLIVDLAGVASVDSINVGTFAATCALADVHQVAVFFDDPAPELAEQLATAGVPSWRLRRSESL
ncbi:anti-anti-sigma factor [Catenuloplanes nepalensis]|uniref:Anti-anti-sigma factor n=1 Tax=Catenuloplanes nepalensis TaxID=587533 RepID=A0ABT9MW41_9ACTN|nr:STAS domain-containing protein [Catenuloplanes nepalensis]MDP9795481.1 anti-anti-sigma factor [Catenuloplanes nepalensis]